MKPSLFGAILGLVAGCWTNPACGDRVDDFLRGEMQQHQVPGVALVILREGKAVKTAAYGLANVELQVPVTPRTVFEIGSITKQFTAAGILWLAQEGKLALDDPLSRYLKEPPANWSGITLRHLLTHTSGIKNYTGLDGFELRRRLTQSQFIAALASEPLDFAPGQSWKYCNSGYNLLGFVIENVSGEKYWDFMQKRIFGPLEMRATGDRVPSRLIPQRASGYEQTNHILINRDYDLTDVFSAGAIASTVLDLARWNAALDQEGLLNSKSKQQMWTPARLNDGKLTNYGFGWFIEPLRGHQCVGHSGSTSGFSASIQRFPDDKLAVILLTNTDQQIATRLAKTIAGFFLPAGAN